MKKRVQQFFVAALPYRAQGPGDPGDSDGTDSASGAADIAAPFALPGFDNTLSHVLD